MSAALVWRQALRRAGHPRSLGTLVPLGVAKLFTYQVVPSGGVSGAILVARGLSRRGVPTKIATATLLVGLVAYFASYFVSVLTSLGVLWLHVRANAAVFVVVAIFVAIVGAILSVLLWMKQWGHRLPARWVRWLPGATLLLKAIAEAPTGLLHDPILLVARLGRQPGDMDRPCQLHYGIDGSDPRSNPAWPGHVRDRLRRDAQPARRSNRDGFGGDALAARPHPFGCPCYQVCGLPSVRSLRNDHLAISVGSAAARN